MKFIALPWVNKPAARYTEMFSMQREVYSDEGFIAGLVNIMKNGDIIASAFDWPNHRDFGHSVSYEEFLINCDATEIQIKSIVDKKLVKLGYRLLDDKHGLMA